MLKERILNTLKFFELQNFSPTLLELQQFLINDLEVLTSALNGDWELSEAPASQVQPRALGEMLQVLEEDLSDKVECFEGLYFLKGQKQLALRRLQNYPLALAREKLIGRHIKPMRHLPFVRGVALAGSQALGEQTAASDIDLLIITDKNFMWLSRTLVTAYFQFLGLRRHGNKIANRFCLNHYVAGPKLMNVHRNLYTASEYVKLRPLVYEQGVVEFQRSNQNWINLFFPAASFDLAAPERQSFVQRTLEKLLNSGFGRWLDAKLKSWQEARIHKEKYIVVTEDELSFHPDSKQQHLLTSFFGKFEQ